MGRSEALAKATAAATLPGGAALSAIARGNPAAALTAAVGANPLAGALSAATGANPLAGALSAATGANPLAGALKAQRGSGRAEPMSTESKVIAAVLTALIGGGAVKAAVDYVASK